MLFTIYSSYFVQNILGFFPISIHSSGMLSQIDPPEKRINRFHFWGSLAVTLKERERVQTGSVKSGVTNIIKNIRESKHRWAGHITRNDNRWAISHKMDTQWTWRAWGRPRTRWCNDLILYAGPTWSHFGKGSCGKHIERGSALGREKHPN